VLVRAPRDAKIHQITPVYTTLALTNTAKGDSMRVPIGFTVLVAVIAIIVVWNAWPRDRTAKVPSLGPPFAQNDHIPDGAHDDVLASPSS